ncbi:MAG: metallophosphoesterase family protein [Acidobacteria bacterium]|nr:metallophosphoesterase family protein [Acidobacteriota bacterium]
MPALAADLPLFYTEPYLLSLEPSSSMDVCWLTSEPAPESFVEFGPGADDSRKVKAVTYEIEGMNTVDAKGNYTVPLKVYQQIARLTGLEPGARYSYRVTSVSSTGFRKSLGGFRFRTAPGAGAPLRFVLLSDLQLRKQIPQTVLMAGQEGPDLILFNGDMVNDPRKAGEWFSAPGTKEDDSLRFFNVMQQIEGGARLLQYAPIYPSPGNHEIDQQDLLASRAECTPEKLSMRIYMQLFRTLYPEQQYGYRGKHWYSADFGDLHVVSLALNRWFSWAAALKPGWFLFERIEAGSPQYNWLEEDLKAAGRRRYVWVTQHWHMFNRATDIDVPYTDPLPSAENPDGVTYDKSADYLMRDLKPLYESGGVNAASFGHSHVYERYRINGVHYIEAASIGNTYRGAKDPPCSTNLNVCPDADETRFRSFLTVSLDAAEGIVAEATQTSIETDQVGFVGRVWDRFRIAPPLTGY